MAVQVRLRRVPKNAYFFADVESQCDQKYLEPYVRKLLGELENQHGITYTEVVQNAIEAQRIEGTVNYDLVLNPLIPFILGHTEQISSCEILDYAEQQINHNKDHDKEVAFIDLCLILGNEGRARRYAERSKSQFDLLDILQKEHGKMPDEIMSKTLQLFNIKQDKGQEHKSARLTALIIRLIRSREQAILPDIITDMVPECYAWDALCLAAALTPEKRDYIVALKESLKKQLPDSATRFWLNVTEEVVKMKDHQAQKLKIKYDGIDPLTSYRIYKIQQCIFHKVDHDVSSQKSWAYMAQSNFYKIAATCLIGPEPALAEDIAQDAARYIVSRKEAFWSVEAAPFETILRMVVCMVTALRPHHSLKLTSVRRFTGGNQELKDIQKNGIMNYVTSKWLALDLGKKLWQEVLYLLAIQNVTKLLLEQISESQHSLTYLAVKIINDLASTEEPIPIECFEPAVYGIALGLKMHSTKCSEISKYLSYNFDHNPRSWTSASKIDQVIHSKDTTPEGEPSRFTGPSFVEKIKMAIPQESETVDINAAVVGDEPAKEESAAVEEETAAADEKEPEPTSVVEERLMESTQSMSDSSESLSNESKQFTSTPFEEKQQDWTTVPKQEELSQNASNMACPLEDGQYTADTETVPCNSADTSQSASAATSLDLMCKNTLQSSENVEKPEDLVPNGPSAIPTPIESKKVVQQPPTFSTGGFDVPSVQTHSPVSGGFGTSATQSNNGRAPPRSYYDGNHGSNSFESGHGYRNDRSGSGNMSNVRGNFSGPRRTDRGSSGSNSRLRGRGF